MRILGFTILICLIILIPPSTKSFVVVSKFNNNQLSMLGINGMTTEMGELRKIKIGIIDVGIAKHPNLNTVNLSDSYSDEIGHGTTVASIIGSNPTTVNDYSGLLPGVQLYSYNLNPNFTTDDLVEGINVLIQEKIDVINLSISTRKNEVKLKETLTLASRNDIIIVTSAGNTGREENLYPASYNIPGIISVGSLDNRFNISSFSTYNSNIDFFCSGENIMAIGQTAEEIREFNGTSVAAPFVTTLVSIIKTKFPDYTNIEIVQYLEDNSKKVMASWRNINKSVDVISIS